jgi:hypothetical protein
VLAPHPDFHIGAVRRVQQPSSLIEFSIGSQKSEVASKRWDGTTEIRTILAGETGVVTLRELRS